MSTEIETRGCLQIWNAVICTAINDSIRPFSLVFYTGENYKKSFARQYKILLKRQENPFIFHWRDVGGGPVSLNQSRARTWFESYGGFYQRLPLRRHRRPSFLIQKSHGNVRSRR